MQGTHNFCPHLYVMIQCLRLHMNTSPLFQSEVQHPALIASWGRLGPIRHTRQSETRYSDPCSSNAMSLHVPLLGRTRCGSKPMLAAPGRTGSVAMPRSISGVAHQYNLPRLGRCARAKGLRFSCVQRFEMRQSVRRNRRRIERQRVFPIGATRIPAASSLRGFPTRVLGAPRRTVAPGSASENLHLFLG